MEKKKRSKRLSMVLLWKLASKFRDDEKNKALLRNSFTVDYFLEFVEQQMKPLKP